MLSCLLETYEAEDDIAKADTEFVNFKRYAGMNTTRYSEALWKSHLVSGVYTINQGWKLPLPKECFSSFVTLCIHVAEYTRETLYTVQRIMWPRTQNSENVPICSHYRLEARPESQTGWSNRLETQWGPPYNGQRRKQTLFVIIIER